MAQYKVKTRIKVINQNTTVNDTDFSGWFCVNTGTANVQVNKYTLKPSEGLDFTTVCSPDVIWDSPIQIVILEEGGEVTLTQLIYRKETNR